METAISIKNLSFNKTIFYPDFSIPKETVTFISGASGCGKSTLFRLLNGTLSPSSGEIFFHDRPLSDMDKIALRRKMPLVSQTPFLFPGTIKDNFERYHIYHESTCPFVEQMLGFLEICCIKKSPEDLCDIMSGGERQRVFLSIALSLHPDALLLDEPTSALNHELSVAVMENIILFSKQNHITLLVISHDSALQALYAEHVIQLGR